MPEAPQVDIAININHLRIILGQELYRMIIELARTSLSWHHQFLQIAFSCLDTEVFLEWFGIIAVTQLPGCLHIKRGCGIIIGEIVRFTHVDPIIKHRLVICLSCRNLVDVFSPLPESKGVFEYRNQKSLPAEH